MPAVVPRHLQHTTAKRCLPHIPVHIPLVMEADVTAPPDIYYVLAGNFKQEILTNNQHLLDAGVTFHFPVTFEPEATRSAA